MKHRCTSPNLKPLQDMYWGVMRALEATNDDADDAASRPPASRPPASPPPASRPPARTTPLLPVVDMSPHRAAVPALGAQILDKVGKGWYTTKYVHLRLDHWGVPPLLENMDLPRTQLKKKLLGMEGSYLRLGTTTIVTGTIVGVSFEKGEVAVELVPHRRVGGAAAWVPLDDVFAVPLDMDTLKRVVHDDVHNILRDGNIT
jgi:hypothetical protein